MSTLHRTPTIAPPLPSLAPPTDFAQRFLTATAGAAILRPAAPASDDLLRWIARPRPQRAASAA